jgi:hypothetical protein
VSYECAIGTGIQGLPARSGGLRCDGCGILRSVTNRHGQPYSWLLDNRAAPRWHMRREGVKRLDLCPECWALAKAATDGQVSP